MKYIIIIAGLFINNAIAQTPLGTEFTYQGDLKDSSGNPHDGEFDFKFTAFDAEDDGTGLNLGTNNVEDVQVTDGIFTTQLDFGSSAFIGDKVWLEINVRIGSSTGGYQQLLPRQQVTATPYATHAQFVGADAISTLEIQNASITAADLAPNSVAASEIVANAVGTSEIITTQVQRRVTGNCGAGDFITAVNEDGTVSCAADNTGLTSVTSAEIVDGTIEAVDIDSSQVQQRVIGSCIYPEYVTSVDENGDLVCARAPVGAELTLDSVGSTGRSSSIAIGGDGNPVISYLNASTNELRVIKCSNHSCSNTYPSTILAPITGFFSTNQSLAIGADNNPIITYMFSNDLYTVKCTNQSCTAFNSPVILDSTVAVRRYLSIAIGADTNPIISYYENSNKDLRVVKCTNQSCTAFNAPITLDSTGDVGKYLDLAIGADANPIIIYQDSTNGDLKVVKCTNQNCTIFNPPIILDSTGIVGKYGSITIGADNNPVISYYDNSNDDLKLVKCTNQSCTAFNTPIILDSTGDVGGSSSIAIGVNDNPIVSYRDSTNNDLKMAKCSNQSCSSANTLITLDSAGNVGDRPSLAIGVDNNPIISYRDVGNGNLKVYTCADEDCSQ